MKFFAPVPLSYERARQDFGLAGLSRCFEPWETLGENQTKEGKVNKLQFQEKE
jgi:hypothetical protein